MDYINFLNRIAKQEMEKYETKEKIIIKVNESRYFIKLQTAICFFKKQLEEHMDIWKNEIEKNGGFLKGYYKTIVLKQMLNNLIKITDEFKKYEISNQEIKKIEEITHSTYLDIMRISEVNPNKKDIKYIDAEIEKETLPNNFLYSFCTMMYAINYTNSLEKTIEKFGFEKEMKKIKSLFNIYEKFIDSIMVTRNFKSLNEYSQALEEIAFDSRKALILKCIRKYKKNKGII